MKSCQSCHFWHRGTVTHVHRDSITRDGEPHPEAGNEIRKPSIVDSSKPLLSPIQNNRFDLTWAVCKMSRHIEQPVAATFICSDYAQTTGDQWEHIEIRYMGQEPLDLGNANDLDDLPQPTELVWDENKEVAWAKYPEPEPITAKMNPDFNGRHSGS